MSNQQQAYGQRVKIGGVYENIRQRDGATYFAGRFGYGAKILIMPNPDKIEGDNLPHYDVFICEQMPKAEVPDGKPQGAPQFGRENYQ